MMMNNYETLWPSVVPADTCVDWDDFIVNFTAQIGHLAKYPLNQVQKEFLRSKIDPLSTGEVYKSGFLLFLNHYWHIPSSRNSLYKMKMDITSIAPKLTLMTHSLPSVLQITVRNAHPTVPNTHVTQSYTYDGEVLRLHSPDGTALLPRLRCQSFVRIGSSSDSEIVVDSPLINPTHLKVFFKQADKKADKKAEYYIRDVSRSHGLRYSLDTPTKHVVLQPQMVISLSLTEDYQLLIDKIAGKEAAVCSSSEKAELSDLLNSDRLNYLGQIDKTVPFKSLLRTDFQQMTLTEVEQCYQANSYYPLPQTPASRSPFEQAGIPTLHLWIRNTKTNSQISRVIKEVTYVSIGRSKSSTIVIDEMEIRQTECVLVCVNNIWLLKNIPENCKTKSKCNSLGVYLHSKRMLEGLRRAKRVQVEKGVEFVLRNRDSDIRMRVLDGEDVQE